MGGLACCLANGMCKTLICLFLVNCYTIEDGWWNELQILGMIHKILGDFDANSLS
jgi:hypothetical protein